MVSGPGPSSRLKTVELAELALQVAEVRGGIERATGDPLDQFIRIVPGAVPVDVLPEPAEEGGEFAFFHLVGDLGMRLYRLVEELDGEDVADGVRREVPEEAVRPVDILQHALGVVLWCNAEVLLRSGVPGSGEISYGEGAFEEGDLELEAQEDVQVVGGLVCLDPDS